MTDRSDVNQLQPRILLVGCDEAFRCAVIAALGLTVETTVAEPCDAQHLVMAAVREGRPFILVILDADHPEEALLRALAAGVAPAISRHHHPASTRYILCSSDGVIPDALACSVNHCFRKPVAPSELRRYLERLLAWEGIIVTPMPGGVTGDGVVVTMPWLVVAAEVDLDTGYAKHLTTRGARRMNHGSRG